MRNVPTARLAETTAVQCHNRIEVNQSEESTLANRIYPLRRPIRDSSISTNDDCRMFSR